MGNNEMSEPQYDNLELIMAKSKAMIKLGKQLHAISPELYPFDLYLIGAINRSINLNKGFVDLMKSNNFISAAPLVRLNLDNFMRLYAARVSIHDINKFASLVMNGKRVSDIRFAGKVNGKNGQKLTDNFLKKELSKVEGKEWVQDIYDAGNSFVHLGEVSIGSSRKIISEEERQIGISIGFHDSMIPIEQKQGAVYWMNEIIDSIIEQAQWWMYDKSELHGFDYESLNDIK
jgi:hypothetical protein